MIFLYLLCVFISLFILYAISRHDFVLLRQSISLRQVFDSFFIGFIVFFLFSRVGYAIYSQSYDILNPLRFLYLTRYWGILSYVGFAGMLIALIFLYKNKKNKLRILDIYSISLAPVILLDVLAHGNSITLIVVKIISAVVLVCFYAWFIKIHNKYTTKDGFITFLTIITYSLASVALSFATHGINAGTHIWFNILLAIVTVFALIFLVLVQKDFFNKQ